MEYPIEIKKLTTQEIPQVAKIFCEAFNHVGEKWTIEVATKRIEQYYNPDSCWIAIYDSNPAGVLTSKIDNVLDHQELYIDIIAVDPKFHKCKIGSRLLNTATEYAKSIGVGYIWMTVNPKLYSYRWYINNGFSETGWTVVNKKLVNN